MSDDNFKMAPAPELMGDTGIRRLFGDELKPAEALAAAMNRLEEVMHKPPEDNALWPNGPVLPTTIPELFFHTKKRHGYVFEPVPVGHDMGWACYDPAKYDGDPADGNTLCGYGKTQDEAYVDYINHVEDDEPPKPRAGMVVHSSPFEPPTVVDAVYRDPDEE